MVNFISKDMWSGLIHFLINTGWYLLYGGLALLGLVLLFIILKCSCAALGMRICSKAIDKGDELSVLEKLLDFQDKAQRQFRQRKRNPLLGGNREKKKWLQGMKTPVEAR